MDWSNCGEATRYAKHQPAIYWKNDYASDRARKALRQTCQTHFELELGFVRYEWYPMVVTIPPSNLKEGPRNKEVFLTVSILIWLIRMIIESLQCSTAKSADVRKSELPQFHHSSSWGNKTINRPNQLVQLAPEISVTLNSLIIWLRNSQGLRQQPVWKPRGTSLVNPDWSIMGGSRVAPNSDVVY